MGEDAEHVEVMALRAGRDQEGATIREERNGGRNFGSILH